MEPVSLAVGAIVAAVAFVAGHLNGRRRREPDEPPRAVCEGCEHSLSFHDYGGRCHDTDNPVKRDEYGNSLGRHEVPCACRQYVGFVPVDRVLANFTRTHPEGGNPYGR